MVKTFASGLSCFLLGAIAAFGAPQADESALTKGSSVMDSIAQAQWRFGGELGLRIDANVENWLLRAPDTNPGLIEMFNRRDRHLPYAEAVPWAGEFAGKYLISAVQACRMSDDPRLKELTAAFVKELVASQAEDGYLGPWPKDQRLLGHWDLWGHYHCMLGLLMWYDMTGDQAAYDCVVRAADCICNIYVEGRRPVEAGTPQINLSVLHVMGDLYRRTGNERYMTLMRRIEEDMQTDGDWERNGEKGLPYFQLPAGGTRWESLHIVQGIVELYRITGEERYKQAVLNLWKSIRDFDRHPSGAFSTNESAHGNVYDPGSIETCCSVAWEALTIDVLKLTGESTVADELELTTWNQVLGAQHPSGSWWTYDTPLDGVRIPSFQHINFQYRVGTPELNCCSVNAPRGLGMLSEWAVMEDSDGAVVVNFYGPGEFELTRANGERLTINEETNFPLDGKVVLTLTPEKKSEFTVRLRIPGWSKNTSMSIDGKLNVPVPQPGAYFDIKKTWAKGDKVEVNFDMSPRSWVGEGGRHAHAALYTGPVLLAFDAFYNAGETADIPAIDMANVKLEPFAVETARTPGHFPPLGLWRCKADNGTDLFLCDFGSAGAHGTDYVSWLPAAHVPPPAVALNIPENDAAGAPGPVLFRWESFGQPEYKIELLVAKDAEFKDVVVDRKDLDVRYVVVDKGLEQNGVYYWKVLSVNAEGATENKGGPRTFRVDSSLPQPFLSLREDGLMAGSALDGNGAPTYGVTDVQEGLTAAPDHTGKVGGAVAFDGKASSLRFKLPFFPEDNYSFSAWVCPEGLPTSGMQQVFSAWCKGGDDPLRVTIEGDSLSARIESPQGFVGTPGVSLKNGEWVHVAAVKEGGKLTLYINGAPVHSVNAHGQVRSDSAAVGIGFNPMLPTGERFVGKIDNAMFYAKALTAEEVQRGCSPS